MHTGFALCIVLKMMISSCQHAYDNQSFTGTLNRLDNTLCTTHWRMYTHTQHTLNSFEAAKNMVVNQRYDTYALARISM